MSREHVLPFRVPATVVRVASAEIDINDPGRYRIAIELGADGRAELILTPVLSCRPTLAEIRRSSSP